MIELLVIIAIISVLVAVVLPLVQQARETARQVQCRTNLKNIGLALHNYHGDHGVFPPAWVAAYLSPAQPVDHPRRSAWAWGALILPYIEQAALYEATASVDAPPYSLIDTFPVQPGDDADRLISTYTCPSDPGPEETGWGNTDNELSGYSKTNYAPCGGLQDDTTSTFDYYPSSHASKSFSFRGMFGPGSHLRLSGIKDGARQTIMLGEVTNATRHGLSVTAAYAVNPAPTWIRSILGTYDPDPSIHLYPFAVARYTRVYVSSSVHYPVPINSPNFTWGGFSSSHPGGAQFALADGSARFVSENIDQTLYESLSTIRGEEFIGSY